MGISDIEEQAKVTLVKQIKNFEEFCIPLLHVFTMKQLKFLFSCKILQERGIPLTENEKAELYYLGYKIKKVFEIG